MRRLSALLLFSFLCLCAHAQESCLARGKELFSEREFTLAEDTLQSCLKLYPDNSDILISLAGVQSVLGKFAGAENNLKTAMRVMPPNSPYIAYVNSLLGDIAMRKPDLRAASLYYDAALRAEPGNVNALVGRGIIEEKAGRMTDAVGYFRRALAVDFTNTVARERLIALEPDILTYEEVLTTMKERNIIDPDARSFTMEDENLLRKILTAERGKSIEFLSAKYGGRIPPGFIVERDSGKVYVRKMLTLTGYEDLIAHLSREAKTYFTNKGVAPADIFKLRDFDGKDIFTADGLLTDAGLTVYTKGLYGQKAYVEPGEVLPSTQREIDALVKQYSRQGYSEITLPEFAYLMQHTQCSEQTLIKDVSVRVINLDSKRKRVFVVSDPRREDVPAILPWQYVLDFRATHAKAKSGGGTPVYSSGAFGLGGGVELKLCTKDGQLATGNLNEFAKNAVARNRAARKK